MASTPSTEPTTLELTEPEHRAAPRAVAYWALTAIINWLVLLGLLTVAWRLGLDDVSWAPYALGALAAWALVHVVVMPPLRHRVHRWEVTSAAVRTRTGWLSREQRVVPLSRIQTVDSSQGALMRAFGLASVTVTTASAAGPVEIVGLTRETADRLVAELTVAAAASPGDAT